MSVAYMLTPPNSPQKKSRRRRKEGGKRKRRKGKTRILGENKIYLYVRYNMS
jgi:hypothetical protein